MEVENVLTLTQPGITGVPTSNIESKDVIKIFFGDPF